MGIPMMLRITNKVIAMADSLVLLIVGREALEANYKSSLAHRAINIESGFERHVMDDLKGLEARTSPLLTHVSIMVAAIAVLISTSSLSTWKNIFLGVEICLYLLLAICCLRCIDQHLESTLKPPYRSTEHGTAYSEAAIHEAITKLAWFELANRATILLTLVLLLSTPVVLLV